jgi:ATP-dependent Zn protease
MAEYQTADATGAPIGPRQDLAERGRAAEEVVYGGMSTGAGNDRAGRHRNPARIIEEYYEQVLATLQGRRDRLARTLLDRETHTSPRRTVRGRPSLPGLHHAYRQR